MSNVFLLLSILFFDEKYNVFAKARDNESNDESYNDRDDLPEIYLMKRGNVLSSLESHSYILMNNSKQLPYTERAYPTINSLKNHNGKNQLK